MQHDDKDRATVDLETIRQTRPCGEPACYIRETNHGVEQNYFSLMLVYILRTNVEVLRFRDSHRGSDVALVFWPPRI